MLPDLALPREPVPLEQVQTGAEEETPLHLQSAGVLGDRLAGTAPGGGDQIERPRQRGVRDLLPAAAFVDVRSR